MAASAATATATPNPNPSPTPLAAGDWTVVRRRRRRRSSCSSTIHPHTQTPTPTPTLTPSPWSPSDPSLDPTRVSRLLSRMHAAISRLASSRFYRRLLSPLLLRRRLSLLTPGADLHLVVYGVGSFESSLPSRLQLALAVLLRSDLPAAAAAAEVFDPVLSAAECAVAAALGLAVSPVDEGCRRRAAAPTLFYMPHCEAALYDALLAANWLSPAQLRRVAVLGNSFGRYARQAEGAGPAAEVAAAATHVLAAGRYTWEIGIDEGDGDGGGLEEEEDGFFRAFNETSWHFFELDDNVDLDAAVAGAGR